MRRSAYLVRSALAGRPLITEVHSGASTSSCCPLVVCCAQRWSGSSGSNRRHQSFRPFSAEDEEQLVSVLTTKPRHVARHIRQSMLHSRKQAIQFRNSVTFLMIQLQGKLQRKEIPAEDATMIVEAVMKECVELRQADMAHLLFRASLRFRKYGMKLSTRCVKYLFDSYKNGAKALMEGLVDELKSENELRSVVMSALVYCGRSAEADAMLRSIPSAELTSDEIIGMLEALGAQAQFQLVDETFLYVLRIALRKELILVPQFHMIASTALACTRGDRQRMHGLYRDTILMHRELCLPLSDSAVSYILKQNVAQCSTLVEVYQCEEDLKKELGIESKSLGLPSETVLISRGSDLIARGQSAGDEIMLTKVQHLRAVIESSIDATSTTAESGDAPLMESIDQQYIFSLIKGFGILGKLDDMKAAFELLKANHAVRDHRVYDEMMRWYGYSNNLKEVLALKEEMTKDGIYHSSMTYQYVFRVLDKHYPRMIEKYYNEIKERNIALDSFLYAALIRVFGDLGDRDRVEALHAECKKRVQGGEVHLMSPQVTVQLMRALRSDSGAVEGVIHDARRFGQLTSDVVQAEIIQFYAAHKRMDEVVRMVENLPRKSPQVFRVLLKDAAHRQNKPRFEELYRELRDSGTRLTHGLFGVLVSAYGQFHDVDGITRIVNEARSSPDIIRSSSFFADAALAFAKVNQWNLVDDCWERLLASKMSITMSTYNRFLDAYMSTGRLDQVQTVLNVMMTNVPPNPITATTVIDMLGKMGRLSEMEALLDEMSQSTNALPTLVTFHQVMNAYAKAGDIHKLEAVRHRLQQQGLVENHVTYNILAEGYGRAKRLEHLQELVAERRLKGIAMEEFGYVILLNIYARAKLGDETHQLVEEMKRDTSLHMSTRLQCTIASAFGYVGDVPMAESHIASILQSPDRTLRDVETVFLIYSRLRDIGRLQQLLEDSTIPKSPLMFNVSIGSFARAGEHSKVAILLQQMESQNMRLSRSTAVTLSSLLLKAGKLQLAQAVLDMNQHQDQSTPAGSRAGARNGTVPPKAPEAPAPIANVPATASEEDHVDSLMQARHDDDLHQALGAPKIGGDDDDEL